MNKRIRRVVTGHNAQGKSVFVMDGSAPHVYSRVPGSAAVTELWETRGSPAEQSRQRGDDQPPVPAASAEERHSVPHHPLSTRQGPACSACQGAGDCPTTPGATPQAIADNPRHAGFHKTDSVDYAIVLAGEIGR